MSETNKVDEMVFEDATGRMRWLAEPHAVTAPPRLQMQIKRFQYTRSGDVRWTEYEWRDVPIEVESAPASVTAQQTAQA